MGRLLLLFVALTAPIVSPAISQQLPELNVEAVCAVGAEAVSAEECGRNASSFFCAKSGQRAIEALCFTIDQRAKANLLKKWETIPSEQKRTCIIYFLSNPFLSYSAIKHCIEDEMRAEPIVDGPEYSVECWYNDSRIMIPLRKIEDCQKTRMRAGNIGVCIVRTQGCSTHVTSPCIRG
jgi:hypothetical protein